MTSPLSKHDRLRAIRAEIERLDTQVLEDRRTAHGLVGLANGDQVGEAEAIVVMNRLKADALLREHLRIAEELLQTRCSVHPPSALLVGCPECVEASQHQRRTA